MFHLWDLSDPAMNFKFGEGVALICVIISYGVSTQLTHSPRMFTVMALLTCVWALVMGVYVSQDTGVLSHLVGDIASFLLVYIGGLLVREGAQTRGVRTVSWLQRGALLLLLFIALARPIDIPAQLQPFLGTLSPDQSQLVFGLCLDLAGFLAVAFGAHAIADSKPFFALAAILVVYGCLQVEHAAWHWSEGSSPKPMGIFLIASLALAKLAFTGVFSYIVLQYANRAAPQPVGAM